MVLRLVCKNPITYNDQKFLNQPKMDQREPKHWYKFSPLAAATLSLIMTSLRPREEANQQLYY